MSRNVTKRDIAIILVICVIVSLFFIVPNLFDNSSQNQPPVYIPPTPPTPPNLTASQAMGVVAAAIGASTPTVRASAGWFEGKFNYSSRQWMVEVWSSENASKQYLGHVYIIDDATGKVLNPPPVYTPK